MKTKLILFIIVSIFCVSCGKRDRPNIPLTEKEISFFEELNNNPLAIDSVTRNIEIGSLMFYVFDKSVLLNLYSYSTEDSLTVKEWDALSDKIAAFYSRQKIEGIEFTYCSMRYHRYENQNGKDYFYSYIIEDDVYKLSYKSYELKEEAQSLDSLNYSTD